MACMATAHSRTTWMGLSPSQLYMAGAAETEVLRNKMLTADAKSAMQRLLHKYPAVVLFDVDHLGDVLGSEQHAVKKVVRKVLFGDDQDVLVQGQKKLTKAQDVRNMLREAHNANKHAPYALEEALQKARKTLTRVRFARDPVDMMHMFLSNGAKFLNDATLADLGSALKYELPEGVLGAYGHFPELSLYVKNRLQDMSDAELQKAFYLGCRKAGVHPGDPEFYKKWVAFDKIRYTAHATLGADAQDSLRILKSYVSRRVNEGRVHAFNNVSSDTMDRSVGSLGAKDRAQADKDFEEGRRENHGTRGAQAQAESRSRGGRFGNRHVPSLNLY